jgi:NHLM bacteriocin system ABC transporter ATP-binding protein
MRELAFETDPPPQPISVESGTPVDLPDTRLAWLVDAGEVEVYLNGDTGRDLLAVLSPGDAVLPGAAEAPERLHLVATAPLTLKPVSPAEARFAGLTRAWLLRLACDGEDPGDPFEATRTRLADLSRSYDAARAEQEARLVARLSGAVEQAGGPASNGTAAALHSIGAALGVEVEARALAHASADAQVPVLCRRVGLRAREILLEAGWHKRDHGPLLVRRTDTSEDAPGLDALIRVGRRYRRSDGTRLDARGAETYEHVAYSVSAPLPADVTGFWGLARFVLLNGSRRDGLVAAFAALIMAGIGVLTPLATVWLLSDIVPSGAVGLLFGVGVALGVGALFSTLLRTAQSLATTRMAGHGAVLLNAAVTDRLLRLPTGFFKRFAPGDLNQRIGHIEHMRDLVMSVAFSAGLTAILSVIYLAVLLAYDVRLALIGLGLVLVYILAVILARVLQMGPIREAADLDGEVSALTYETLDGVAKLRASAAEDRAITRWLSVYRKERLASIRAGRVSVGFSAFADAYQTVTLMILFAGAGALAAAEAPAAVFIGFLAAFGAFQAAIIGLSSALLAIYSAQPLIDRARPILEAEPETAATGKDPGPLRGEVEASGLTFAYRPGSAPVLNRLDFRVQPGDHMAIVGASGSGKSTLLRLLLGFETPQTGTILYDGQELGHLDLTLVRGQIGVVLQASDLFAGSILDNIRGASNASLADCLEAAAQAGLARDLEYFAMGVHTPIAEGATTLSGGQRQRILIARALAAKPNILFFDEATSALDNATQAVVSDTLDNLQVTRITIAHRLSTVRHADQICVLQDGKFIEQGRFDELMAKDGAFAALARRQLTEG